MAKSRLLSELETLNQTSSRNAELQTKIAAQNAQLAELARQQAQAQAEALAVARQQELQLRMQTVQLQLQTDMMQLTEARSRRQRDLKNAAFAIKRETDRAGKISDVVVQVLTLQQLDHQVQAVNLTPGAVEEIADKEYVEQVLRDLRAATNAAVYKLTSEGARTVDWLTANASNAWSFHEAEIAELRKKVDDDGALQQPRPRGLRSVLPNIVVLSPVAAVGGAYAGAVVAIVLLVVSGIDFSEPEERNLAATVGLLLGGLAGPAAIILYNFKLSKKVDPTKLAHWEGRQTRIDANLSKLQSLEETDRRSMTEREAYRKELQRHLDSHPLLADLGYAVP